MTEDPADASASKSSIPDEVNDALPSQHVDHFIRVKKLGAGGMGEVWKAWDTHLNRWVALKFIKTDDPDDLKRLHREARAVARLSHPNIVQVYDVREAYIVLQYVEGVPVSGTPRGAARLIRDAAQAVHYAHTQGVVHRDLKPGNMLLDPLPDGRGKVWILDFGLAKQEKVKTSFSVSGAVVGTPAYMPPEQADGKPDKVGPHSDIYALGATLYDLLTGRPPFRGAGVYDTLKKVIEEDPVPPGIDGDLDLIVLKCLQKDPSRRYRSAAALADDLDRWLKKEPIEARPPSLVYLLWKALRRNWLVASSVLAVGLTGLVAAGVFWRAKAEKDRIEREAVEKELSRLRALEWIGKARDAIGKRDLAGTMVLVDRVLEKDPQNEEALSVKAVVLSELGEWDKSLECLHASYGIRPDPRVAVNIGKCYYKLKKWPQAAEWLSKGWRDNTLDTGMLYAEVLSRSGRHDEAEAVVREMLADRPDRRGILESLLRTIEAEKRRTP